MLKKNIEQFNKKLEKEKMEIREELEKHKQTYKERLADIDSALKKIKNGKYGVCEKCKKEISLKLLKIDPESRMCQECKKKA